MANGAAAVALLPESKIPSAPTSPTPNGIEQAIGDAVASAVIALAAGLVEVQGGGLTAATRSAGGERSVAQSDPPDRRRRL
jgi:hypothetical protein